jgi:hypothetical protein
MRYRRRAKRFESTVTGTTIVLVAGLGLFKTFAAWGELQTEAFFAMFEALYSGI